MRALEKQQGRQVFEIEEENCQLEVPSKKGRSRAVGLKSVLLLASTCNS